MFFREKPDQKSDDDSKLELSKIRKEKILFDGIMEEEPKYIVMLPRYRFTALKIKTVDNTELSSTSSSPNWEEVSNKVFFCSSKDILDNIDLKDAENADDTDWFARAGFASCCHDERDTTQHSSSFERSDAVLKHEEN
ncbi:MAG: hypothetical protein MHPSP_001773 [Paramarteilia canceri]